LLDSFSKLRGKIPYEIIIVDDNSSDSTSTIINKWCALSHPFKAKYLRMEQNCGPANARNHGILSSVGDAVAFTDSDCIVDPYWLDMLNNKLLTDHNYAGVGGSVRPLKDDIFSKYYTFYKILEPPESMLYLVSANCIYWRDRLLDVHGFDSDIKKPGGEDVGLSLKLYKKGYRFGYEEKAVVYHDYRSNLTDFAKTFYNYGYGCRIATARHFGDLC
jgi:glycosyltransferase involved in cell wall biosynthesis